MFTDKLSKKDKWLKLVNAFSICYFIIIINIINFIIVITFTPTFVYYC